MCEADVNKCLQLISDENWMKSMGGVFLMEWVWKLEKIRENKYRG